MINVRTAKEILTNLDPPRQSSLKKQYFEVLVTFFNGTSSRNSPAAN